MTVAAAVATVVRMASRRPKPTALAATAHGRQLGALADLLGRLTAADASTLIEGGPGGDVRVTEINAGVPCRVHFVRRDGDVRVISAPTPSAPRALPSGVRRFAATEVCAGDVVTLTWDPSGVPRKLAGRQAKVVRAPAARRRRVEVELVGSSRTLKVSVEHGVFEVVRDGAVLARRIDLHAPGEDEETALVRAA